VRSSGRNAASKICPETRARELALALLPESYCICRLDARDALPAWANLGAASGIDFISVTRTRGELSIVGPSRVVPAEVPARSDGWRCLRVVGVLELSLPGVLLRLLQPLAAASCPVFTVATYETDYLLVTERDLPRAVEALRAAGHVVHD
jgi:hypothetical protein